MKSRNLFLKITGLLLSVALGATFIWWRIKREERMPWINPENYARIMAEARANGWVVAAHHKDGSKYYFMGSSKYGWAIRPEDLSEGDYMMLWRYNQTVPEKSRRQGTTYKPSSDGPKKYSTFHGDPVELDLTVDVVAPGTTVEEILKRESK
jgi:hypothetical protein